MPLCATTSVPAGHHLGLLILPSLVSTFTSTHCSTAEYRRSSPVSLVNMGTEVPAYAVPGGMRSIIRLASGLTSLVGKDLLLQPAEIKRTCSEGGPLSFFFFSRVLGGLRLGDALSLGVVHASVACRA